MVISLRRQANVSKQTTLLDCADIGSPKWRICRSELNRSIHEGMINVKVHLKTHSGKVNIQQYTYNTNKITSKR